MIRLSWEAVPGATAYELEFVEGVLGDNAVNVFEDLAHFPMDETLGGNLRNYVHSRP